MKKVEIAKELTIAALNNKLISNNVEENDSYVHINQQIAENVAAFFNKLVESLNISESEE